MPKSLRIAAMTLLLTLGVISPKALMAGAQADSPITYAKDTIQISTRDGKLHPFTIELAATYPERAQGLMFRRHMDKNAGMLFLFEGEDVYSMWMKNTYIPLDMVFIRKDGTIARIQENTTPESLQSISSGTPVVSVLELNAGTCGALGIKPGDNVIYKAFNQEKQ